MTKNVPSMEFCGDWPSAAGTLQLQLQWPINLVLFDFGNVIARFNNTWFLERLLGADHPRIPDLLAGIFSESRLSHRFETGQIPLEEFQEGVQQIVGRTFAPEVFAAAYCDIFQTIPETCDLIRFLHGSSETSTPSMAFSGHTLHRGDKVGLGLLSNTNILHFERVIKPMSIFPLFDQVTASFEAGAMKPSPEIFQDALRKFGGNPREVLYLDDIPAFVDGARKAGMQAVLFDNPKAVCQAVRNEFQHGGN